MQLFRQYLRHLNDKLKVVLNTPSHQWQTLNKESSQQGYSEEQFYEKYSRIKKSKMERQELWEAINYFLKKNEEEALELTSYYCKKSNQDQIDNIFKHALCDNAPKVVAYLVNNKLVGALNKEDPFAARESFYKFVEMATSGNSDKVLRFFLNQPLGKTITPVPHLVERLLLHCAKWPDNTCGDILLEYEADLKKVIDTIEQENEPYEGFFYSRKPGTQPLIINIEKVRKNHYKNDNFIKKLKAAYMVQQLENKLQVKEETSPGRRRSKI